MIFWLIGAILVLSAVSLSATFEQIYRDVDREFEFGRGRSVALLKILQSEKDAIEFGLFWSSISGALYKTYNEIRQKQNEFVQLASYMKTVMDYQEIALNLGNAILGEGK